MSQRILLIDAGNSRIKWAFCQAKAPHQSDGFHQQGQATHTDFLDYWPKHIGQESPPQKIIISNVAGETLAKRIINQITPHYCIPIEFVKSTSTACGINNGYKQPQRLGIDRWLAMIAAWHKIKQAVCIIDCGTATTLDVIDKQGQHLGGLILPGLESMRRSLLNDTADLHHAWSRADNDFTRLLAQDTEHAMMLGITHSLIALIEKVNQCFPDLTRVITGGLAPQLLKTGLLPNAMHVPDLVLLGLKTWALDER